VLDFGCGYGADVIACCRHGIDAVGVERRQFLVESAQQKATELGMGSRFYNVNDCACLAGKNLLVMKMPQWSEPHDHRQVQAGGCPNRLLPSVSWNSWGTED